MNTDKVLALAKLIEANEHLPFNMVAHETCFCAWLHMLDTATGEVPLELDNSGPCFTARDLARSLDIPYQQGIWLAMGHWSADYMQNITREDAVAYLREVAARGEVSQL